MSSICLCKSDLSTVVKSRHQYADRLRRHLLGKKSWNVYNTANIERVRKDEKAAAAKEEAEEQRMQEVDAERRIRQLRGIRDEQQREEQASSVIVEEKSSQARLPRPPKRKRLHGEDDTDRDLRLARHDMSNVPQALNSSERRSTTSNAPLVDASGHTNLFPVESSRHRGPKNPEAEAERAKKEKELEDQYTMRFSNAAGFKNDIGQMPWYQTSQALDNEKDEAVSKDVWGRSDPRRKERDQMRLEANDPLMMMKQGVKELRKVQKERKEWSKERMEEFDEPRSKRHGRKRHRDEAELDDFRLDDSSESAQRKSGHRREGHRSHRHHNGHNDGHDQSESSRRRRHHRHHSYRVDAAR